MGNNGDQSGVPTGNDGNHLIASTGTNGDQPGDLSPNDLGINAEEVAAQPFLQITPAALEDVISGAVRAALANLRMHERQQQQTRIPLADITAQIPTFSGDTENVEAWLRRIDIIQETHRLENSTIFVVATNKLTKRARCWYEAQVELAAKPWPELKEKLRLAFQTKVDKIALYDAMRNRKWRRNETIEDYFYDKLRMLNTLNTGLEDTILYIIRGLENTVLRIQLKSQTFTSVEELLTAMKSYAEELPVFTDTRTKKPEKNVTPNVTNKSNHAEENPKPRCFNCFQTGHYKTNCPNPTLPADTCFNCRKTGHLSRNCPTKKTPETRSATINVMQPAIKHFSSVEVTIDKTKLPALIDSGSSANLIREDVAIPLAIPYEEEQQSYIGLGATSIKSLGRIYIPFNINDEQYSMYFSIIPKDSISHQMILGEPLFEIATVTLSHTGVTVKKNREVVDADSIRIPEVYQIQVDHEPDLLDLNPDIGAAHKARLNDLIAEYQIQAMHPEPTVNVEASITLTETKEICHQPRRLAPKEQQQVRDIVDRLLKEKVIQPSSSSYSSPIVLVRKKTGDVRMCQDYRDLNAITRKDRYPLPFIEDIIDKLGNKSYFTLLDLKNGFHQIKMSPDSIKYTSFVTPFGQYEYLRLPFGLTNAPRIFQRFVNTVLIDLIRANEVAAYIDDCMIATHSIENNFQILEKVLNLFAKNGLQLRLSKCKFFMSEIEYLGYNVSSKGIKPGNDKIKAVSNFPQPRNVHEVRSFLGLANYFRKFIKDFSRIAKPLTDLTRKSSTFSFNTEHKIAFEKLKTELVNKPLLTIFDAKLKTEVHTDASSRGFAGILMQLQEKDKKYHPVYYFSAKTNEAESKYHSFELETIAVVKALTKFRIYLLGIDFTIITDCNALKQTLKKRDICPRINRWALQLLEFQYVIEHRKASFMEHVDALSRHPVMLIENDLVKNLQYTQYTDLEIKSIIEKVNNGDKHLCTQYIVSNGLLFRKYHDQTLLVVPNKMRRSVITEYHDNNAHIGVDKVLTAVKQYYWFRNLRKYITQHIKHCMTCIQFNDKNKKEGKIHMPDKGDTPFNILHVDHFSLMRTSRGNVHVLLTIDAFTKFVFVRAVKQLNSKETIKCLAEIFSIFGNPKVLISDRGTAFTSHEFENFCNSRKIKHTKIAVSSPEANGQVERYVRTTKNALMKCSDPDNWDQKLEFVQTIINNTVQKSIGCTPNKLFLGYEQNYLVDSEIRKLVNESNNCEPVNFEQIRAKASDRIKKLQCYNKAKSDQKRSEPFKYEINDLVCIRKPQLITRGNAVFVPKFQGPYIISKILENDRYLVEDIPGLQHTQKFYVGICAPNNMKLWSSNLTDEEEGALVEDD